MNEETIKKDRSPNYPKHTLEAALEHTKTLHTKIGKAKVSPLVAVGALGYSGLNGATLTLLASLGAYGLIDRERGEGITVSPLAIKLIHSVSEDQKQLSLRESALKPSVFSVLFSEGFHLGGEDVITNHLIQKGFTPDGARKASSVYIKNYEFSKLDDASIKMKDEIDLTTEKYRTEDAILNKPADRTGSGIPAKPRSENNPSDQAASKILARYSIPLGANEATLVFTGDKLSPDDFDALLEYVQLFKKQYERKLVSVGIPGLQSISGNIATQPKDTEGRVAFLLALQDGQVLSCLSGAGTKFTTSQFVNGEKITLVGERKSDFILGETPFFVFSEFRK